jgi:ATP phosphoribosyltransferase regulatory subunit
VRLWSRVRFDLGLVHQLDYYTGVVFRGYVRGASDNILSGGRYDNLLSFFGAPAPATGFAINTGSLDQSLQQQKKVKSGRLKIAVTKGRLLEDPWTCLRKWDSTVSRQKPGAPVSWLKSRITASRRSYCRRTPGRHHLCVRNGRLRHRHRGQGHHTGEQRPPFYEVLDLGYGNAALPAASGRCEDFLRLIRPRRVARPSTGRRQALLCGEGHGCELSSRSSGSVELAPFWALADANVDIVQTGPPLKANGLVPSRRSASGSAAYHRQQGQYGSSIGTRSWIYRKMRGRAV